MKKFFIIGLNLIFFLSLSNDILAQLTSSKPEIAKWKLEDEHERRREFRDDGKMYSTYEGTDALVIYKYTISSTPPVCQKNVSLAIKEHIDFLQIIDEEDGDISCFYIYALNEERFTALDALSGEVFAFIKAED